MQAPDAISTKGTTMATFCHQCGTELAEGAGFCGSCGAAVPAAPTQPASPAGPAAYAVGDVVNGHRFDGTQWVPVAPPAASRPPAPPMQLGPVIAKVTGGGLGAPLTVAGTMLAVSLVLSLAVGFMTLPDFRGAPIHKTFALVSTWIGSIWASIFGADLGGHASGHASAFSVSGSAGISAVPLTLAVLTLGAGVLVFRKVTARKASLAATSITAGWAALLTVIPLLIMTWIVGMNTHDLEKAAGFTNCGGTTSTSSSQGSGEYLGYGNGSYDSSGDYVGDGNGSYGAPEDNSSTYTSYSGCGNEDIAGAITSGAKVDVGPSSTQVFFVGFVVILVVLLGATLTRRELYAGRYTVWVRNLLRGPVSGFGWLVVALIPAGWIYFACVYFLRPEAAHGATSQLSAHDWMNLLTFVFAGGANLGAVSLGLGAWGSYGYSASAPGIPEHWASRHHGLSWIASSDHTNDPGFWFAAGLAPLVLAFTVIALARAARREGPGAVRWSLGMWIVSMLAAFPLLDWWAGLGAHASGGANGVNASVHADTGFDGLTILSVFGYTAVIGLVAMVAAGGLDAAFRAKTRGMFAGAGGASMAAPVTYQVGDIVNGHRFDGTQWVPVTAPPASTD